jgi:hypothetical protein
MQLESEFDFKIRKVSGIFQRSHLFLPLLTDGCWIKLALMKGLVIDNRRKTAIQGRVQSTYLKPSLTNLNLFETY